ncbi:hypothetical protein FRC12_016449 [Ceratobasidium sp. 428]|nr:hypothetical protein FRC12_016449 [Ceratobasidium sp. 428]
MRFIPASDPNKATYGISTGLKYACHVPMACGTTSYFAKNACDLPSRNAEGYSERGRNAVEIVTLEDLGDTSSCRSGIAGLLQARLRHRELGGWHSTPNLANSLQSASEGSHPSPRSQSPCFNSTRRQAGGPQGSEFRSTALRQCWTASKARQISITHLEWYEFRDGTNQFMLCLLNFPPAMHKKPNWLRLERRSKRHGLGSVAERAKILVGEHSANDIAIFSTNRGDLLDGENDKFTLKEAVDKPIPFSFMLDVLDLAHKNLASSISSRLVSFLCASLTVQPQENDSWLYVSFVMSAIHQFCEPARLSSDNRASIQSNNPHYIIKTLADRRHSSDLEHEITLQHDWEVLDLGDINEPYNDTAHEGVPIPEYRFLAAA